MGIKTEDFVPGFPPKEMTEGVDWLGILDVFDPSVLEEKYLNECARRNPFTTCYKSEPPFRPVGERLRLAKFCVGSYRQDLELAVQRIEREGLSPIAYKNARAALVTAIGIKGAAEVVKREYDRLGEEAAGNRPKHMRLGKENGKRRMPAGKGSAILPVRIRISWRILISMGWTEPIWMNSMKCWKKKGPDTKVAVGYRFMKRLSESGKAGRDPTESRLLSANLRNSWIIRL